MNLKSILRYIGQITPDYPIIRALGNRALYPIHKFFRLGGGIVKVQGNKMRLNPDECVDRNLWFTPHLYDKHEIAFALRQIPRNGVFIDAGSNIGYWALRIAKELPTVKIYAIEANPFTAKLLEENVAMNSPNNITILQIGLSSQKETKILFCNNIGNRGGDSFIKKEIPGQNPQKIEVNTLSLSEMVANLNISKIDFIKMDIEGLEENVLNEFFTIAPKALYPSYICVELIHSPNLENILIKHGFVKVFRGRENGIFSYKL